MSFDISTINVSILIICTHIAKVRISKPDTLVTHRANTYTRKMHSFSDDEVIEIHLSLDFHKASAFLHIPWIVVHVYSRTWLEVNQSIHILLVDMDKMGNPNNCWSWRRSMSKRGWWTSWWYMHTHHTYIPSKWWYLEWFVYTIQQEVGFSWMQNH